MPLHDDDWRRRARSAAWWSTVVGLLLTGAAAAVTLSWRDDLPARVGSHWDGTGTVDDTQSVEEFVLFATLTAVAMTVLFAGLCLALGRNASVRRTLAGAIVWSGGLGAALMLSLAPQRDLADGSQATMPGWLLALVLLAPVVPAIIAAALVPGDPHRPTADPVPADAPRAALAPGQEPVWTASIGVGTTGLVVSVAVAGGMVAGAVLTRLWVLLIPAASVVVLLAAVLAFTARIDTDGLRVRSVLGWPRTHVPADEVVRASVTQVNPLGDFGGWGWRAGFDRRSVGVVLRTGDALTVERTGDRVFVVTVDDAAEAAALLNTVADRARS
ncbi:DUF1648 domain-containing protein [Isoptericola jiangsuensis]|uniref:DUF1648 domain-containing protein n=1 Tax=Isoptericola jiangsuensis TaxID=548579 RepID=UPI003AAA2358